MKAKIEFRDVKFTASHFNMTALKKALNENNGISVEETKTSHKPKKSLTNIFNVLTPILPLKPSPATNKLKVE